MGLCKIADAFYASDGNNQSRRDTIETLKGSSPSVEPEGTQRQQQERNGTETVSAVEFHTPAKEVQRTETETASIAAELHTLAKEVQRTGIETALFAAEHPDEEAEEKTTINTEKPRECLASQQGGSGDNVGSSPPPLSANMPSMSISSSNSDGRDRRAKTGLDDMDHSVFPPRPPLSLESESWETPSSIMMRSGGGDGGPRGLGRGCKKGGIGEEGGGGTGETTTTDEDGEGVRQTLVAQSLALYRAQLASERFEKQRQVKAA